MVLGAHQIWESGRYEGKSSPFRSCSIRISTRTDYTVSVLDGNLCMLVTQMAWFTKQHNSLPLNWRRRLPSDCVRRHKKLQNMYEFDKSGGEELRLNWGKTNNFQKDGLLLSVKLLNCPIWQIMLARGLMMAYAVPLKTTQGSARSPPFGVGGKTLAFEGS